VPGGGRFMETVNVQDEERWGLWLGDAWWSVMKCGVGLRARERMKKLKIKHMNSWYEIWIEQSGGRHGISVQPEHSFAVPASGHHSASTCLPVILHDLM
jgi:hypothetical protein